MDKMVKKGIFYWIDGAQPILDKAPLRRAKSETANPAMLDLISVEGHNIKRIL